MEHCELPFWEAPMEFLSRFHLKYRPNCEYQIWNLVARLFMIGLFCGLIGSSICGWNSIIICMLFASVVGFVIIMTTPMAYYPAKVVTTDETQLTPTFNALPQIYTVVGRGQGEIEGFQDPPRGIVSRIVGVETPMPGLDTAPYSGPSLPEYTPPSARNPFMNVLLDEYKYNPERPPAVPNGDATVKQTLDDFFRVQWFSDPTDVFGKNQSQRQFVTQPSTSIPNDRDSYQNWLYKIPGKTCKEGGRSACTTQGSAGVQYTWMGE
jgi:hypothetical protein